MRACSSVSCSGYLSVCSDTDSLGVAEEEDRRDRSYNGAPSWAPGPDGVAVVGRSCRDRTAVVPLRIKAVGGHCPLEFVPKAAEPDLGSTQG